MRLRPGLSSRAERGICTLLLLFASTLAAQETHTHTPRRAFLMEAGAGALGSFVGMVPVMFISSCFTDAHYDADIDCKQPLLLGVFVVSPPATALGVSLTTRHTGSPRSVVGAWIGALAGGAAGVALANGLDRSGVGPVVTFPVYYATQATISVVGSRVGKRLRLP